MAMMIQQDFSNDVPKLSTSGHWEGGQNIILLSTADHTKTTEAQTH